jgi:hypothetical protein
MAMKKLALVFALAAAAAAQTPQYAPLVKTYSGTGAPTDACGAALNNGRTEANATPVHYLCSNATGGYAWNPLGGSVTGVVAVQCVNAAPTDLNAIQAALNSSPLVTVFGSCNFGTTAGHHLVLNSGNTLNLRGAITYSPSTADVIALNHAQTLYPGSPVATETNASLTTGSNTITLSTVTGSQSLVGDSIWCIGGLGSMGTTSGVPDLHTSVGQFISTTQIMLADPPQETASGVTCKFYTRDSNISIIGGSYNIAGAVEPNANVAIRIAEANNVYVDGITVQSGASTNAQGSYNTEFYDISGLSVHDFTGYGWNFNQDGVHVEGPADGVVIDGVFGNTGDDSVAILSAGGQVAGGGFPFAASTYGPIHGVSVSNVFTQSFSGVSAVHISPLLYVSSPLPLMDQVFIHNVAGQWKSGTAGPHIPAIRLDYGPIGTVVVDGVSNYYGNAVTVNQAQVTNLTVRNISTPNFGGYGSLYPLVQVYGGTSSEATSVTNMLVDGVQINAYQPMTLLQVGGCTNTTEIYNGIKHLQMDHVAADNLTGGNFIPVYVCGYTGGSVNGDWSFNHWTLNFNGTNGLSNASGYGGVIGLRGATFTTLAFSDIHVSLGSSFTATNAFGLIAANNYFGAGNALGNIVTSNVSLTAPGSVSNASMFLINNLNSWTTLSLMNTNINNWTCWGSGGGYPLAANDQGEMGSAICPISRGTVTVPTTAVSANSCNSLTGIGLVGLGTSDAFADPTPTADVTGVTGFGPSAPGLYFAPVITAASNTAAGSVVYKLCNSTASSITPSSSSTWNIVKAAR